MAMLYALSRSVGGNDINYDIDELPEFAKLDTDPEFTKFLDKRRKHRKGSSPATATGPHVRRRRLKPSHTHHASEQKEHETDTIEPPTYSLFDPNNPNYSADLARNEDEDDTDEESEEEIGFSTDQHYVPFKFKPNKTKRKPDAPFMAMLQMYATNSHDFDHHPAAAAAHADDDEDDDDDHELMESKHEDLEHQHEHDDVDDDALHGVDSKMDVSQQQGDDAADAAMDIDTEEVPEALKPFLNDMEKTHVSPVNGSKKNALESLKERYYKKQLPSSLQFDTLSKSFQSNQHQANIQNDLEENDSFFEGIKQSVQMITHKNE
eukprot:CAMPEP_0202687196 /NCGR_PEP_ID=MMETSP1385-20130828/2898_1 /ASSEMBLY_ACC=CAM_ASM_000861 /TAXON_ID=933848 /ORGANISM="Elphidium margaritaceum" /LENGTH=320 /DNA_ID=CAMNT_0049341949 /DNA_START=203 /DNA_END=1165 /DNA_ORIENTATION=+